MLRLRMIQNIKLGIRNLMMHKLRSFLTILGVVFGVGSVIAMLSVGEGASKEALDQIRKLGSNNVIITSVKPIAEKMNNRPKSSIGKRIPAVRRRVSLSRNLTTKSNPPQAKWATNASGK